MWHSRILLLDPGADQKFELKRSHVTQAFRGTLPEALLRLLLTANPWRVPVYKQKREEWIWMCCS
jgi:hypothetical protein